MNLFNAPLRASHYGNSLDANGLESVQSIKTGNAG